MERKEEEGRKGESKREEKNKVFSKKDFLSKQIIIPYN